MSNYAFGLSEHPIPSQAVGEAVGQVLEGLGDERPDLVMLFTSPHHAGAFEDVASSVRGLLDPTVLLGGTAGAVIGGGREIEDSPALSLFAARLPATMLTPVRLEVVPTPDGPSLVGWPDHPDGTMLLLADPFTFPADAFLERVNEDLPKLQIIGGLASAAMQPGGNRLALDDQVTDAGAVGVVLSGGVEIRTVVSQGCRPVGKPYVVTRSDRNFILELGGKPALQRLQETATAADEEERELMRRGLQIGCVVDETRLEFSRGDFLVRGVVGADQLSGAIAVGDSVPVGRTVQFQVRDAGSADEDLRDLLTSAEADAALLFTCNGRGQRLFGEADHDAGVVDQLLGPLPLAGCFCAGELGPVGARNFLHGFTASLALFTS
ncbi:MAG TPA: FIST N-terminal domain-containing protein [Acidimicrobiia bacterium]|nr:FIST N-terminal domain-containing protein [Acidimicrobiia bacterium]